MSPGTKANPVIMADVEAEEVRWLWPGRIPLGKLTILNGDPGTAKTTLALDLIARVSRGGLMPDRSESALDGPRGAVFLTAEDGLGDTIRPRLEAAGADLKRVASLPTIKVSYNNDKERLPSIEDIDEIRQTIEVVDAALITLDPLNAYLPSNTDSHRDASVRGALSPLLALANETGIAVLAIRHLKKSEAEKAMYRGLGSIGFTGAARSDMIVGEDPDDETGERRVLAETKNNLSPPQVSLAYRIEMGPNGAPRIGWLGPSPHNAEDLVSSASGSGLSETEAAKKWLEWVLGDGPVPSKELKVRAEVDGHAWRTVRRAMKELGVETEKDGMDGGWSRKLPDAARESDKTPDPTNEDLATFEEEGPQNPHEDATSSKTATSQEDGHLRDHDESAKTANQSEPGHLRESPGMPGDSGDGEAEDGQPIGGGDPDGEERKLASVPTDRVHPDGPWSSDQ